MSNHSVALTGATFDETVNGSEVPIIVDFWADWCGPCKKLAPILDEIASEYTDDVRVAKVNVDEHPEIATRYNVLSLPTLLVFRDGEVIQSLSGARSKAALLEEFGEFLPSH